MCSRFEGDISPEALAERFGVLVPEDWRPAPEIRPTNRALVIDRAGRAELRGFGIPAPWDGKPLINARAETLVEKPTFRPWLENRCLVPASAWFEWRAVPGERRKRKNRIARRDGGLIVFAGLTDDAEPGAFTIVTCAPAPGIAHVHNRMPLALDTDAAAHWLDPDLDFAAAATALRVPGDVFEAVEETPPAPRQRSLL
jgi:putative SOS response-associated peptidase YedK